jgi:hypothetical protein
MEDKTPTKNTHFHLEINYSTMLSQSTQHLTTEEYNVTGLVSCATMPMKLKTISSSIVIWLELFGLEQT